MIVFPMTCKLITIYDNLTEFTAQASKASYADTSKIIDEINAVCPVLTRSAVTFRDVCRESIIIHALNYNCTKQERFKKGWGKPQVPPPPTEKGNIYPSKTTSGTKNTNE